MKRLLILAAALAATSAFPQGITAQQADAILQELRNIRALLERGAAAQPAPQPPQPVPQPPVKVSLKGAYVLGKVDAPVICFNNVGTPVDNFQFSTFTSAF